MMKIEHIDEADASYEYLEVYRGTWAWAFCRNGKVIRWLDKYETGLLKSVASYYGDHDV